ncbi:MAG TPA: hypothetical protein VEW66_08845 [Thermomicrobiales bacterium]|nr:hypothetical protein [Thermomicrobiales bacterium]
MTRLIPWWPLAPLAFSRLVSSLLLSLLAAILARARLILVRTLLATPVTLPLLSGRRRPVFLTRATTPFGNLLLPQLILRRSNASVGRTLLPTTSAAMILGRRLRRAIIRIGPCISGLW